MLRRLCLFGLLVTASSAQSPLTTLFTGGNGLAPGASVYFQLVLNVPLTFNRIDVNSPSPVGTPGTITVRWCAGTYVGNDTNAAAWTVGASAPATAAGPGVPTTCPLPPFTLPAGIYGFNVHYGGLAVTYSNGNGTTQPGSGTNQLYSRPELSLLAGACATGAPGVAICCQPRVFNGSLHFVSGAGGVVAQRTDYGIGCYARTASFYEAFATAAAFDLANRQISMLPTAGGGYSVRSPGLTGFVAPSGAATVLALADDGEVNVTLGSAFPFAGGSTTSLTVCSNGFVSVAPGNGTGFAPTPATLLLAPRTAWWALHDNDPTAPGSGAVKFEEIGAVSYVTFDGVYDYVLLGGQTAANASTYQFQFDRASGAVHLVFQAMSAQGNGRLVGYSPGGPSSDPGGQDLSALPPAGFALAGVETPLALSVSARPLLGTVVSFDTTSVTGVSFGVHFLGTSQIPAPGLDLGVIGAPGCPSLVGLGGVVGQAIQNASPGGLTVPFVIPNNALFLGFGVYAQSAWFDPTANALGLLTSNGIELVIGNV